MPATKSARPILTDTGVVDTRPKAALSPKATAFYKILGERIRKRRVAAGMTQEALAIAVGAARTSITNMEKGKQHLPLHMLLAVAGELDIEVGDLMPTREQLASSDEELVALTVKGKVRMVSPKTASAISSLLDRSPSSGDHHA